MNENIEQILSEVKGCQKCKTIIGYKKFPLNSHGKIDSEFMLVSEAPGKDSVKEGKYWIGAGGKILRACFVNAEKTLEDIFYLTDIVKCWPNENNENRTPNESEITNCSPFLKREIESLKPKLILSFGKKSSEYLLNKKITLKSSHGRIFDYNDFTQVLVMYHPSGIDRFMKRDIYTSQLKALFKIIVQNKIDDIEKVFDELSYKNSIKPDAVKSTNDSIKKVSLHYEGFSFIFPAPGNEITQADISKNQLRVTADFKNHFPNNNSELKFTHNGIKYNVKFTHKGRRSHILKLGSTLMKLLNLNTNTSVKITKINSTEFEIEIIK